jgi:hypothetical protein
MRWSRASLGLIPAALFAWGCGDAPVGPDVPDTATEAAAPTEVPTDLGPLFAQTPGGPGPTGAIFTTTPDGGIVNENVRYPGKIYVYLDGGPPPNAPQKAAGLDDNYYVFQITDPSGKYLLSEDPSRCRVIWVEDGIIQMLVPPTSIPGLGATSDNWTDKTNGQNGGPCHIDDDPTPPTPAGPDDAGPSARHDTNVDVDYGDNGAIVVQMMPYGTTPNPGGVYKAWVTPLETYLARGGDLDEVPSPVRGKASQPCPDFCADSDPGFGPPRSVQKTDNFKVREQPPMVHVYKWDDLDGDGVLDEGEPEIGTDVCVEAVVEYGIPTFTVVPCSDPDAQGWPVFIDEDLDGDGFDTPDDVTTLCYTPCGKTVGPGVAVRVREALPADWLQTFLLVDGLYVDLTGQPTAAFLNFMPGQLSAAVHFGNFKLGKKAGTKFHDQNANGVWDQDPLEPGLANWTIFVDYDDDGFTDPSADGCDGEEGEDPCDVTDANGDYLIQFILPGTHPIYEVLKTDWTCSYPNPGTPDATTGAVASTDCSYTETFTSGAFYEDNDFGNWTTTTKSGKKWEDLDADGVIGETDVLPGVDEMGLGDWTIYVDYNGNGKKDAGEPFAITSGDAATLGQYTISGIVPGTWKVREIVKKNDLVNGELRDWFCSFPNDGAGDKVDLDGSAGDQFVVKSTKCWYEETFKSGVPETGNDFGNWDDLYKSGKKFLDQNKNGQYDEGELGLEGFTFYVDYNDNGTLDEGEPYDDSDAEGLYKIGGIYPGTWRIREVQQSGYVCVFPATVDQYGCYHLETFISGIDQKDNYFGNRPTEGCTPGYWKQEQHFDSWFGDFAGAQGDPVKDYFTPVGFAPYASLVMKLESGDPDVLMGMATLLQALQFNNSDVYGAGQLVRHGVAAMLNAANPNVAYGYSVAQIIALVEAALETEDAFLIGQLHAELMDANERGCPLN